MFRNIQRLSNVMVAVEEELPTKVNAADYNRNLKRISLTFQMTDQRMNDLLREIEAKEDRSSR